MLISNLPQFQNQNFQSFDTSNLSGRPIYQGVPFSVYAAPKGHHNYGGYGAHQGYHGESTYEGVIESESVESTFEPYDAEDELEEDQWDDDDNEWSDDDNEWSDEDSEDDSTQIQAPVPVASPFSNASFPNQQFMQPVTPAQPTDPGQNLFNPFPALNSGQ